jgi:hypothetical protein
MLSWIFFNSASSLKQQSAGRHFVPIGHIILIPSQPAFALSPLCCDLIFDLVFGVLVRARLCKLQKGCTRLAAASDKVYQLLPHGRWLSPGTPASSTTKTVRHDIAEILFKVENKLILNEMMMRSALY